jgi:hypothetical protein
MKPFPQYLEIIGKLGVVCSQLNGPPVFIGADKLRGIKDSLPEHLVQLLEQTIGSYNCYTHYLALVPEDRGPVLYCIDQHPTEPQDNPSMLKVETLLQTTEFRGPDRNLTWFKALCAVEFAGNLTTQEKLGMFKLRASEYQVLEPYIIDYVVEFLNP